MTMALSAAESFTPNSHKQLCESGALGQRTVKWNLLVLTIVSLFCSVSSNPFTTSTRSTHLSWWGKRTALTHNNLSSRIADLTRGGAVEEEEDEYDEEGYDDEYDAEDEDEDEVEDEDADEETDGIQIELNVEKYDEPWVASPLTNLYATFGVMMLTRRFDLFSPTVVRIAR